MLRNSRADDPARLLNRVGFLNAQARATLLTLQHYAPSPANGIEEDPADTYLFHALLQRSLLWLQVEPLGGGGATTSGSSTSGEVRFAISHGFSGVSRYVRPEPCSDH